jgi:hypothetical protein
MAEEEDFNMEEESDSEEVKKEKAQLDSLGVSSTWNLLSETKKEKKEEKKTEFRGFK